MRHVWTIGIGLIGTSCAAVMTYPNLGDHDYSISKTVGPKKTEVRPPHEMQLETGEINATDNGLEVRLNERDLCPEDSLYIDIRTRNWTLTEAAPTPMDPVPDALSIPIWFAMDVAAIYGGYRWAAANDPSQINLILNSGAVLLLIDAVGIGLYAGTSRRKSKRIETQTITCGEWNGATPITNAEVSVLGRKLPVAYNPERSVLEVPAAVFGAVLLQANTEEGDIAAELSVTRWQETPGLPGSLSTQLHVSREMMQKRTTPWRCAALQQDFASDIMQDLSPTQLGDTIADLQEACPESILPYRDTLCGWASTDLEKGTASLSTSPAREPSDIGTYITWCSEKNRWETVVHAHLSSQAVQSTNRNSFSKSKSASLLTARLAALDAFENSTSSWLETLGSSFAATHQSNMREKRLAILQEELFRPAKREFNSTWATALAHQNLNTIAAQNWLSDVEKEELITRTKDQLLENLLATSHRVFVTPSQAEAVSYKELDKRALDEALQSIEPIWGEDWVKATKGAVYRAGFDKIYEEFMSNLDMDLSTHRNDECCFFHIETVEECDEKAPVGLVKDTRAEVGSAWYKKAYSKVKKSHKACIQSVQKIAKVRAERDRERASSSSSSSSGKTCRPKSQWRKNGNQALTDIISTNYGGIVLWCQDSGGKRCVQRKMNNSKFTMNSVYGMASACCCDVMSTP